MGEEEKKEGQKGEKESVSEKRVSEKKKKKEEETEEEKEAEITNRLNKKIREKKKRKQKRKTKPEFHFYGEKKSSFFDTLFVSMVFGEMRTAVVTCTEKERRNILFDSLSIF